MPANPLYAIAAAGLIGLLCVVLLVAGALLMSWAERRFGTAFACDGANCPDGICICGAFE